MLSVSCDSEAGSNEELITELEFPEALSGLSKHTASGPDKVPSQVLYNVYTKGLVDLNSNGLSRVLLLRTTGLSTKQPVTSTQQSPPSRSSWKRCHVGAKRQSEINPNNTQDLWCTLNNKAAGQTMLAVSFKGEVLERTNSLRYLGIHFGRMLTQRRRSNQQNSGARKDCPRWNPWLQKALNNIICSCCVRVWYSASLTMIWILQSCHSLTCWRSTGCKTKPWVILGTTKDTPIETMRYLLDLPSMETRHKVEQVKAYLTAMQNPKNPLRDSVKEENGCRLTRGKSWMGQTEQSI